MSTVYSNAELRYFRLAKGVLGYSASALRKVFIEKWNFLYPSTPWQNDGKSASQLLEKEKDDPAFSKGDHEAVKEKLSYGDVEEWDVTALVFALCHSQALRGIRCDPRWGLLNHAIHAIKQVRNTVLSHASKPSISRRKFQRNFEIVVQAVENLLSSSDPLVEKLKKLPTEREFVTEELLVLKKHLERLGYKVNKSSPVDLAPARTKPAIFRSARYILLINKSSSMSYNFRWEGLDEFLRSFNDDVDMQMFADIQAALSLSHQSKKDKSLEMLNGLIPKLLTAEHGVVLHARIKINIAYILHDCGKDDEAMKEADEAEKMLSLGECHEDIAEVNNAKANIILSSGKNSKEDRERILHHLHKCLHFCEEATVDKSVTVVQAKIRKALLHLGYYQHDILEEEPSSSDVSIAENIFNGIAKQSEPIAERSKVYLMYGQSLLAYRQGDISRARELESKVRKKCERHLLGFEIQQLDNLKALVQRKAK